MKRSFIILTIMSLVAVSCGSSGQYAGALFQDGIYESSVPASDLALLPNAAGTQFNDQLELEYDEYGWSTARTSSSIIFVPSWTPWTLYAYGPASLYWNSWYWDWYHPHYYPHYPHYHYPLRPEYAGRYNSTYTPHAGVSASSSATRRPSSASSVRRSSSSVRRPSASGGSSGSRSTTAVRRSNSYSPANGSSSGTSRSTTTVRRSSSSSYSPSRSSSSSSSSRSSFGGGSSHSSGAASRGGGRR